jgi:Immunoglobulin I-set domain
MVSVQCILGEGDLPVKILWEFNDNPLESGDGIMISSLGARVSNMMIESVEGRHAGNYTCSARNRAGTKLLMAELEVIGTD